jgi:1-aminocyclopropane-1-carboxylate deaminase
LSPNPVIDSIPYLSSEKIAIEALRLDQIHPIVSGNKWYKLRYYIKEALAKNASTIASFGGPYSNHLVALAYTAKENGLKSIGYVRANEGEPITPTLQEAIGYGMELIFLGRTGFQEKKNELLTPNHNGPNETYFIDEGGYGVLGAKGAATIISDWENTLHAYDYIICAVGTGTMIAGIINAVTENQKIIGIPVLKNEGSIRNEILNLLQNKKAVFELLYSFHQGGYAKTTKEQIEFMNRLWENAKIPSDIVYTGKVFYAVEQLVHQTYFKTNSKVLIIHSGGLQGNRSLDKGVLNFD